MSLISHKGLDISLELKNITQSDLEQYYKGMRENGASSDEVSLPEYAGMVVRMISDLGFFVADQPVNIDDWKPAKTIFVMTEFSKLVAEAMSIPKE